jgi:hypothetical protein
MNARTAISAGVAGAIVVTGAIFGQLSAPQTQQHSPRHEHAGHTLIVPGDLQWQTGPESLPRGAQFVVLEGDPSKEGPFTMRIRLPENYRIPPHTHPKVERVTVLEGEMKLGTGRRYEERTMERLPAGAFFAMPPGMEHFAGTDRGVMIQLNGVGPWEIHYIDPADDPRRQSK